MNEPELDPNILGWVGWMCQILADHLSRALPRQAR